MATTSLILNFGAESWRTLTRAARCSGLSLEKYIIDIVDAGLADFRQHEGSVPALFAEGDIKININRKPRRKLTSREESAVVRAYRRNTSGIELAKRFSVSQATIYRAIAQHRKAGQ